MVSDRESDLCHQLSTYLQERSSSNFDFPPATEAQLRRTEELLELSFPPLLRALYTQIANGSFGPGGLQSERISGALGGFRHETTDLLLQNKQFLLKDDFSFVDIEDIEAQQEDSRVLLFDRKVYPNHMFSLWEDGYYEICLQCKTGRIYLGTDDYNALVDPGGDEFEGYIWFRVRNSLADWLVSWLQDETITDWLDELEALLYEFEEERHGKRALMGVRDEDEKETREIARLSPSVDLFDDLNDSQPF